MAKIWLVIQESCVDGEIYFNATPCATEEVAKRVFEQVKKQVRTLSHFSNDEEDDYYKVGADTESEFFIDDPCDDYYENIYISECELVE
jgi:flavodoxin